MNSLNPSKGHLGLAACALVLLAWQQAANAGRPLASDDAGTADAGTCQVEVWAERSDRDRATVIAPACGIAKGVELGSDYTLPCPARATCYAARRAWR